MKKKVLSLLVVFAMVFTMIPATAFAGIRTQGQYNGVKWQLSDTGVLTISPGEETENYGVTYASGEMGNMESFLSNQAWKYYSEDIQKIVIADGVKYIGEYAFMNLYNAKELVLGKDVTEIRSNGFYGCGFTSITIPKNVKTIGESAFQCGNLTSVTFSEGLVSIGSHAFEGSAITDLWLPSTVTSVGKNAFHATPLVNGYEDSEAEFIISNEVLLKGNVRYFPEGKCVIPEGISCIADYAFEDIEIGELVLPESLRYIGAGAFYGGHYNFLKCDKRCMTLDLKNVTHIGNSAFSYWYSLDSVDLSNVEHLGERAFFDCHDLVEVTFSDRIKYIGEDALDKEIHDGVLYTKITLPEQFTCLEYVHKNAFMGTPNFEAAFAASTDGFVYMNDILLYVNPKADMDYGSQIGIKDGTRVIADCAFDYFSSSVSTPVTSLNIPDSVQAIGDISWIGEITDIYYAGDQDGWDAISKISVNAGYPHEFYKNITIHCAKSSAVNIDSCNIDIEYVETEYTGETFKPVVTVTTDDGKKLVKGTDYTVSYTGNKNVGTGAIVISGQGNYMGTVSYELKITKVSKDEIIVKLSDDKFTYKNEAQTPKLTVKDRFGNTLKKDRDYTVTYNKKTRKSPGRYKITVKFKGNYKGTKSYYYTIVPGATSTIKANLSTASGGYDDVVVKWDVVSLASGYHVYYKKSSSKKWLGPVDCKKKSIGNSYTKKNLDDGVKYDFEVVAYYKDPNTGKKYEAEKSKVISIYTLAKTKSVKVTKSTSTKVKVSWTKVKGVAGYEIAKMTKSGKKYKVQTTYTERKNVSSTIIKPTKGKTYHYKVRAYHNVKVDGKTKKVYGPWSDIKSYKLKK